MSYDSFGSPIQFSFPDGEQTQRSVLGACLGVSIAFFTFVFLVQNLVILFGYGDSVFTHSTVYGAFDSDYGYSENEGFQIAFGLRTKQPSSPNRRGGITVEQSLRIFDFKLVDNENGDFAFRPCTEEELVNMREGGGMFFPAQESYA